MIVYPIANDFEGTGKDLINWVVETNGEETIEDWNQVADPAQIIPLFETLKLPFLDVQELIRDAREVYLFPLVRHEPLDTWVDGRVALLGDAAHAMFPRGGNGITQAMIDARIVVERLVAQEDDPHAALLAYDAARREPVYRIVDSMRGEGYEVIRRIVADRTGGKPFDDVEQVLPLQEADEIFSRYHALVGSPRPGRDAGEPTGFRTWESAASEATA